RNPGGAEQQLCNPWECREEAFGRLQLLHGRSQGAVVLNPGVLVARVQSCSVV
ncbi:hypothetical protein KI387_013983, partial [Taxus chinensis]